MRALIAGVIVVVAMGGCSNERRRDNPSGIARPAMDGQLPAGGEWFVDRAAESGLDFVHFNGMSGDFYDAEIFAPGVALLDYDNDGDLDVFIVQGLMLGSGKTLAQASFPPTGRSLPLRDRLFRNDLEIRPDGTRVIRFTDVTEKSGLVSNGYGMGVAVGDVDNDGWPDIYVTRLGRNQLFRNNHDGTFTDISKQSGTDDPGWSVSASFFDFDRDGWLDLYVGHYLRYSVDHDVACKSLAGQPDYCPPRSYAAEPDRLYRNNRNGTFTDVTATALQGGQFGPALGVVSADFNGDGWIDLYVANDGDADIVWLNQRDGTLKNIALLAGAAFSSSGQATASMGVDAGDVDNDGDEDLFHANLTGEGHTLLLNNGSASFDDVSRESGLTQRTLPFTGFGAAFVDVDNDSWLDLLTVNGAVRIIEALAQNRDPFPFHQHPQLFLNRGGAKFEEVTDRAGAVFRRSRVGRGAAFGDLDNDGAIDVVVANNNGPAQVLVNEIGRRNHWVGLRLLGRQAPRDMLGARVRVALKDGRTLWRRARTDGSYASANDPRVVVGLGRDADPVRVRVRWPDGQEEEWPGVAVDRYTTLVQGGAR